MTLEDRLGHRFTDAQLLRRALVHRSYYNENKNKLNAPSGHNERLEFLGDAVLDLALSDLLMRRFPDMDEGTMSKIRASLVNERILAQLALEFDLPSQIQLGRGELKSGGRKKPRLLASAFEAMLGAFYWDAGFNKILPFVSQCFGAELEKIDPSNIFEQDYKTRLQEIVQLKDHQTPEYQLVEENGPDHNKVFTIAVYLKGKKMAEGQGTSKKQAEQEAAKVALQDLGER